MFSLRERKSQLTDFGELFFPEEAAEPILARPVRNSLLEWLTELNAEKALAEVGVKPRKKLILDGPPGVGKTTLAHHLAARLGLVMIAVKPERIISKYVGETGQHIGELFDLAGGGWSEGDEKAKPLVLFLDEFNSYSRQRRKSEQASDDSRNEEVNTLLQRIEQHKSFVIGATNMAATIDQAIWRRFDMHITLELPGQFEREHILRRYLAPFGMPKAAFVRLAESFETGSPALMRAFCENLKRQIIVGPLLKSDMRKEATIERILAAVHPHPEVGKPRLWNQAAKDAGIIEMPWPLPLAADVPKEEPEKAPTLEVNVVPIRAVKRK